MALSKWAQGVLLKLNISLSAISFSGSLFIIFCWVCLRQNPNPVFQNNLAFDLVCFLSVADALFSIGNFMGNPAQEYGPESGFCKFQGFWLGYFEVVSLFWSAAIALTLQRVVLLKHNLDYETTLRRYHAIIWTSPLILAIPPFFTDSYGDAQGWCWIKNDTHVDKFWRFYAYYGVLWFVIIYDIVIFALLYRRFSGDARAANLRSRLRYYPLVLIACRSWSTANRVYQLVGEPQLWLSAMQISFSSLLGLGNALVYGLTPEVRQAIREQICGLPPVARLADVDLEPGAASAMSVPDPSAPSAGNIDRETFSRNEDKDNPGSSVIASSDDNRIIIPGSQPSDGEDEDGPTRIYGAPKGTTEATGQERGISA